MPKAALRELTETMFYVLMAFEHEAMCGTDAADFIARKSCGRVRIGPATLYTILGKFEKEKYIKEIEVSGRKRTYKISERGHRAYLAELERLKSCISDAEREG